MRAVRALLGGRALDLWVPETEGERARGLQGFSPLLDREGMLFVGLDEHFAMLSVGFPIDMLFFRDGKLSRAVTVRVGDPRVWGFPPSSAVIEVRGGWARDHGVGVGAPLFVAGV